MKCKKGHSPNTSTPLSPSTIVPPPGGTGIQRPQTPTAEQPIVLSGGVFDALEPRLAEIEANMRTIAELVVLPDFDERMDRLEASLALLSGRLLLLEQRVSEMVAHARVYRVGIDGPMPRCEICRKHASVTSVNGYAVCSQECHDVAQDREPRP